MSFVERIKLTDGTEVASVNASNQLEVAEANSAAIKTAVEIIDNAISGNEMQVDVVAALPAGTNNIGDVDVLTVPAPLSTSGNGTAASALRVTVASDSTGTIAATQSGTWNVGTLTSITNTVTVGAAVGSPVFVRLSDGTNPINTVRVDNAGTFAVQVDGAALTSLQLLDDVVATDGSAALTKLYQVGGTDGTNAQILSTNASGHLNIADGNNSITVDGTVAATQSGTWILGANSGVDIGDVTINNASIAVTGTFWQATQPVSIAAAVAVTDNNGSLTVDAPVGTPVFVRLSDGASAISTLPVSLASVPSHPVTNAGTFAVQVDGAALTALQLLDDTVATAGSAALTKLYQVGGTDGTNARVLSTNASGHVNIADGNNSITVDAPVATPVFVRLSDGASAISTLPVSLATVPSHPVTNAGTFAVQVDGAALTSLQLLDDVITTDGAAIGSTKLAMIGGFDGTNAQYISTNASGWVNIADGNSSITVDGTVAATQSGTWNIGTVTTVTTANLAADDVHDLAAGTTLVMVGGIASSVLPTDVQTGDAVRMWLTTKGAVNIADGGSSITVDGTISAVGDVAHDSADSGNPVKIGAKAIAHGTNPTQVAAGDRTDLYANRHGILWTIGGHPNVQTKTTYISDASNAQTGTSLVGTISAGSRVVVTSISVTVDSAVTATGGVAVKVGFSTTTTLPADGTGVDAILLDHKGIAAGSGIVIGNGGGIIGIGADDAELRLTCEDPVGGGLSVTVTYYTIES